MRRPTHFMAALAATCLLLLSACSGGINFKAPDGGSNKASGKWGDWIDIDQTSVLRGASGDKALIKPADGSTPYVINAQGQKQWEFPAGTMAEGEDETFYYDDDHIYTMLRDDRSVIALDWASGEQAWQFNVGDKAKCADPKEYDLYPGAGDMTNRRLNDDNPLILGFTTRGDEPYGPPECTDVSSAEMGPTPMNFGIDPASGDQLWEMEGTPNLYGYRGYASDPLGKYLYMMWDLRGEMRIARIDIHTGDYDEAALGALTPEYLWTLDEVSFLTVGINEFGIITPDATARVRAQGYGPNGDTGKLLVRKDSSRDPWSQQVRLTASGIGYKLQFPDKSGDKYTAQLIAKPGDGKDTKYNEWQASAPDLIDNKTDVPQLRYLGDNQVIDADPNNPIVVVPAPDRGVIAYQLADGVEVWESQGEQPGARPSYSAAAGQVSYIEGEDVVTVDATSGKEVSRESAPGAHAVWSVGRFQVVESRGSGPTRMRVWTD